MQTQYELKLAENHHFTGDYNEAICMDNVLTSDFNYKFPLNGK